jgi:hypothetical protein
MFLLCLLLRDSSFFEFLQLEFLLFKLLLLDPFEFKSVSLCSFKLTLIAFSQSH